MADTCYKHSFELATGVCRQCRYSYCTECLVYPRGEKKPPYCVTCALSAAGVRRKGAVVNPNVKKRGIFGRRVEVEVEAPRERTFDEISIELPEEALNSPVMTRTTRRAPTPDLRETVATREEQLTTVPPSEESSPAFIPSFTEELPSALDDWAASLGDPVSAVDRPDADPWPESDGAAAWPDSGSSSGSPF